MNPKASTVTLLTGGGDRPYVFGLVTALTSKGTSLDLIGSDQLHLPEFRSNPNVNFLNLRGDQRTDAGFASKVLRVLRYYLSLLRYAQTAHPRIFHILWNNKIESFDRTLLMLYYKLLRKKTVLTAHNVNAGKRDCRDTLINRLTLRIQYRLCDRIFVHTEKMKSELTVQFGVARDRVTVIPFGINNAVPQTALTPAEARRRLEIRDGEKAILFFGRITPYKGLEFLVAAFRQLVQQDGGYRLIIAGRPDRCEEYWATIRQSIAREISEGRILLRAEFISDDETEVYFKAADVLVLPYRDVYQSGVMFLGYSFGLPVLAADVGSLKDEIVEGNTGFLFRPEDPDDLARTFERYFASDLYSDLASRRQEIRNHAAERHSWDVVGQIIMGTYGDLLRASSGAIGELRQSDTTSL